MDRYTLVEVYSMYLENYIATNRIHDKDSNSINDNQETIIKTSISDNKIYDADNYKTSAVDSKMKLIFGLPKTNQTSYK